MMTDNFLLSFLGQRSIYDGKRTLIGEALTSATGNLVLRIGETPPHSDAWHQVAHLVLSPDEVLALREVLNDYLDTPERSSRQAVHDAAWRERGSPWCDTCQHAAVYLETQGFLHSTPEHPFGHPGNSDPYGDHEVTMRQWNGDEREGEPQ